MKVRRTLLTHFGTAIFSLSALIASTSAMAGNDNTQDVIAKITQSFVNSAISATTYELQQNIATDVLTASYHVTPVEEEATYGAKVEIIEVTANVTNSANDEG